MEVTKDTYGDPVSVDSGEGLGRFVYLCMDVSGQHMDVELTPKKARKVARALKRAAKEAEAV